MGDIAQVQDQFNGGEWSPTAQGRIAHPKYRTALNVCRNSLPMEEGAWSRRSGTWHMGTTRSGVDGRLINFNFTEPTPYKIELTNGHLRMWASTGIVYTNDTQEVISISTDTPAVVTITPSLFATNDQVEFIFTGTKPGNAAPLQNRAFIVTETGFSDGTQYSLADAVTGAPVDGATLNWSPTPGTITIARILDIATPYTSSDWSTDTTRFVQSGVDPDGTINGEGFLLAGAFPPQVLECTEAQPLGPQFASFTLTPADFIDGPYLDPPTQIVGTASALSGPSGGSSYIGVWASGTSYVPGNVVYFEGGSVGGLYADFSGYFENLIATSSAIPFAFGSTFWTKVTGPPSTPASTGFSGEITFTIGYQVWDATVTYNAGDVLASGLSAYISLTDGNLNNLPGSSPNQWQQTTELIGVNNGAGFLLTDVGRAIRFYSEPALWNNDTSYGTGDPVQYPLGSQQYWIAQGTTVGTVPGTDATVWLPGANVAQWAWGRITSVLSSSSLTVMLAGMSPTWTVQGALGAILYLGTIYTWALGVYSATTGYPTVGAYNGGRLWLSGAIPNRFDAATVNGIKGNLVNFAPTAYDGTVSDGNGLSVVLNADTMNEVTWIRSVTQGVLFGTLQGEWLAQSTNLNDPITPTTVQVHETSHYGGAAVEPLNAPIASLFVQKLKRSILEYLPDVFTGRYRAPNLNIFTRDLTGSGIEEIRYQEEIVPLVWARCGNGSLIGSTYRRINATVYGESQDVVEAAINGWHRHDFGTLRAAQSIIVGPDSDGTLDTLSMVTNQPNTADVDYNVRHVEMLLPLFEETDTLLDAWFLDDAIVPSGMLISTTGVTLYGLWDLNGKTVTAWIGGLDTGDFPVSNGQIFVPWGSAGPYPAQPGLFTQAYLQGLSGADYGLLASELSSVVSTPAGGSLSPATMQWLVDQNPAHGAIGNSFCLPAWKDGTAIFFTQGTNGLVSISLTTGQIEAFAASGTIFSNSHELNPSGAGCVGSDGFLYFSTVQNTIAKIDAATLTLVAESATIFPGVGIEGMAPISGENGAPYILLGINNNTGPGSMQVFNCSSMTLVVGVFSAPVGSNTFMNVGSGITVPNIGFGTATNGSAPPASMPIYRAILGASGVPRYSTFANIAATAIGKYTTILAESPVVVDATDNNLLIFVTMDSNVLWLLKINTGTGALMWKVQCPGGNLSASQNCWNGSRITGGTCVFQNGSNVCVVDTLNGVISSTALGAGNGQLGGGQASDSVTGVSVCFSNFSAGTSAIGAVGINGTPPGFTFNFGVLKGGFAFRGASAVQTNYSLPAIVGATFTSQGQILRAGMPQDAGTQLGPAVGKTKRSHMYGAYVINSVALSFGTTINNSDAGAPPDLTNDFFPAKYLANNDIRAPLGPTVMYTGILWDVLSGSYSFDDMLAWQVYRPYPTMVGSVSAFRHTQER